MQNSIKKVFGNIVAIFVVLILFLLIIPLSPGILDLLFLANITISLIILMITMHIKEALDFSIFPSMLLITTLFRLGLNVSSTRLILTKEGQAGKIIETFGSFVLQGNVVVGTIIFIIIVLVQFIVIAKGAERVAEVAARFTLDAMPGKQMAIDADLSSGLITEDEARLRRHKVQKESDFYGAMDGATKIVKGDAIMSIIITLINFIAGSIIGSAQMGKSFSEVLKIYSIATIGDGLVSQIPSLLISTATGMIVTRSVSEGSLNEDVNRQFMAQPKVLMLAGFIMSLFLLIPGSPKLQTGVIAGALFYLGYSTKKRMEKPVYEDMDETSELIPDDLTEEEYYKNIENIYSLINVEPIEMEFGYSLIPLIDESRGGNLINRIVLFRRQYAQDMGFVIPSIRLRDDANLNPNQYVIKLKGEEIAKGEVLVDYYLALEPSQATGEIDGIDTIEPAYGIPSKWITYDAREKAELYGYTVVDPLSVIVMHLSETVKKYAHEILTRSEMIQLIENSKKYYPDLVQELIPNIVSYGDFQALLCNLLKEGIPIKDMETIMETVLNANGSSNDVDRLTEQVRIALKRTITRKFCDNGQLRVLTMDADLERTILTSMNKTEQGVYLTLNPDIMQSIISQISNEISKFRDLAQTPIILTSGVIRLYFYRFIEQFYPNICVLSFNEITSNVQIQSVGNITL